MNTSSYISLGLRRWKETVAIALLTAALSSAFGMYFNRTGINATVFMSIGARQSVQGVENETSDYEKVQASDQFTETVQGWFKNPELTSRIDAQAGESVGLTARKQEKQNLVVTYKTTSEEQAKKIAQLLQNNLQIDIAKYNRETNSDFQLAIYSVHTEEKSIPRSLFALLGVILGLFLGILISYCREYFFNLASYDRQIEETLGKKQLEKLHSKKISEQKVSFLGASLGRLTHKKIALAGVNVEPTKLFTVLKKKLPQKTLTHLELPQDSEKLSAYEGGVVVVCQLGKTKLDDLQRVATLLPKDFHLVILQ